MNAKQLIGVSALVLGGAVSAQTVPPEQWVGPPITFTSTASRDAVVADYVRSSKIAQAPQELRVGPADAPVGALSRAEVTADLTMWTRSGMAQASNVDSFDAFDPKYGAKMATYQRLRNGPEYRAEVERVTGRGSLASNGSAGSAGQ